MNDDKCTTNINNATGNKFGVKVGVYQGSTVHISPLLFVIMLEALSRECREGLSWEMFYVDDLVTIAKMLEEMSNQCK